MIIIKCSTCGKDINITEDMFRFACPYCQTIQNRQMSNQDIPMAIPVPQQTQVSAGFDEEELLKRIFMELEDGQFRCADELCEQILNYNSSSARAYLGKLMAELKVRTRKELAYAQQFEENINYRRFRQFADEELKKELQEYVENIRSSDESRKEKAAQKRKKICKQAGVFGGIALLVVFLLVYVKPRMEFSPTLNKLKEAEVGDTVTYGSYEQDGNKENGKEPIQWVVAEKKKGKVLLVSQYYLEVVECNKKEVDASKYPVYEWMRSDVRDWLNYDFYEDAFSKMEKFYIKESEITTTRNDKSVKTKDNVFVLGQKEEANIDDVLQGMSEYAKNQYGIIDSTYDKELEKSLSNGKNNNSNVVSLKMARYNLYPNFCPSYCFLGKQCYVEQSVNPVGSRVWIGCMIRPAIWVDCNKIF